MENTLDSQDETINVEQQKPAAPRRRFEMTDLGSSRIETQGSKGGTTDWPSPNHD